MSDPRASWLQALALLEQRLEGMSRAVDRGAVDVLREPFEPPAVDGPLPADLRGRAVELVRRGEALMADLTAQRQQVAASLSHARSGPAPTAPATPPASMLDARV